jgi:AcrR family transcriptional regulator
MSSKPKRKYDSGQRGQAAEVTKGRVLNAAKVLFMRHGIDRVTIAQIAEKAKVAASTIYALYKSKEGLLRALIRGAIFGPPFQAAQAQLKGISDPVQLIALTANVARAIYENESAELGLMRGASAFSPALRKLEQELEKIRFDMQEERVKLLFASCKSKPGLDYASARRILWMYTSRDIYRMLVHESGWTPDQYQAWLSETLVTTLVDSGALAK